MTSSSTPHQDTPQFKSKSDNLIGLTRDTFRDKSAALWRQFESERRANQHNMESGIPIEDFFRQEFGAMLHEPYSVGHGKIVDHHQYTCGDCDFIIYDRRLAPLLRPPATPSSRRKFFAFETTYGIIEIKSTLTLGASEGGSLRAKPSGTLWDACKKIFAYKELHRDPPRRIVTGTNDPIGVAFFYNCEIDISVQENRDAILDEFTAINTSVQASMRVNAVYVLNQFSLAWCFVSEVSQSRPAFITLQHPVESPRPTWASYSPTGEDTLYHMYTMLWSTLARTQLAPPDLLNEYGAEVYLNSRQHRCKPASFESFVESAALSLPKTADLTLARMRGDYDRVQQILSNETEKDPANVDALLKFANFLHHKRRDADAAEKLFRQAVANHPDNAQVVSYYAEFIAAARQDSSRAQLMLRKLVSEKHEDPDAHLALALFLIKSPEHVDEALEILRSMAILHPDNIGILDTYATHLRNAGGNRAEAERIYNEIVSKAPNCAAALGNYAQLLFLDGRTNEGRAMLDRAFDALGSSRDQPIGLIVELHFYRYAHLEDCRNDALKNLKYWILLGVVSLGWNLDQDVALATQNGHPQPRLLRSIADAITGCIDLQILQRDPEWKSIA